MNNKGKEYLKKISIAKDAYVVRRRNDSKLPALPKLSWAHSAVQERIMRLGIEVRAFGVDARNTKDLETMAIATLIEDFIRRVDKK